ncbi:YqzG/YhdC family protein [Bacillus timonensis]|nr:YqzG/YhdC family protein [Bacillus timonensis]
MKQKVTLLVLAFCMILGFTALNGYQAQAENEEDYKKWGRIAMDVAKLNYTDSQISDYQYKGREEISDAQSKDTFELKVKDENRSFTARVIILFNPKTNSLISLTLEEKR